MKKEPWSRERCAAEIRERMAEMDRELTETESLRAAARLMRQRANAATPGPWRADGSEIYAPTAADYADDWVAETLKMDSPERTDADAQHIASWHPAVALAVADWLDEAADSLERLIPAWTAPPAGVDCPPGVAWRRPKLLAALIEGYYGRALAVARAYMGGAR